MRPTGRAVTQFRRADATRSSSAILLGGGSRERDGELRSARSALSVSTDQSVGERHLQGRGAGRPALGAARPSRRLSFARGDRLRARLARRPAADGRRDHAGPGQGQGRRADPDGWPSRDRASAPCRSVRLGDRRRARHRRRSAGAVRDAGRGHGAHAYPCPAWQRPSWFTRHSWDFETSLGESARIGAAGATAWASTRRRRSCSAAPSTLIGKRLAAFGQGPDRFGLIHCDLRLANLLIDGER